MAEKFYITTAIDYVNAKPHIGHAFEKVLADALARWHRISAVKTRFLTGTDENAQKNAEAAALVGIPTQKFVDNNSEFFVELCEALNISYDVFIRTTENYHIKKAKDLFQTVYDKGDIYLGKYEGLYCSGCESFVTEKELVDGKCVEHDREPQQISEDAYFFKLSKYKDQLVEFIQHFIVPDSKKKEILSRLQEEGLKDLCVSRTSLDWGIPTPLDENHTIYVWFDALTNYLSGAADFWPADVHIVGKGINWFHSVIWPAMLMSADLPLPKKLLVHGYLTFNGQKISKSLGNAIDPLALISQYGVDAVRYNLLRGSTFEDFDFSESELVERNNTELANKFGNLVSRVSSLAEKHGFEASSEIIKAPLDKIKKHIDNFELDKALSSVFSFVDSLNEFIQEKKPWETKNKKDLYTALVGVRDATILLYPFIPNACEQIAEHFSFTIDLADIGSDFSISEVRKSPAFFQKLEYIARDVKPNLNKDEEPQELMEGVASIEFSDFEKLDIRVGEIQTVEDIEGADKLYKLTVSIGEEVRTICAGIKAYYSHEDLRAKKVVVLTNLKPRKLKGVTSQGMLLAAGSKESNFCSLLTPDQNVDPGMKVS